MKKTNLATAYAKVVNAYIRAFEKKQECELQYWVADRIGEIADFGDTLFLNFSDIKHDIDTNQPAGLIVQWSEDCLLYNIERHINYQSYCLGLRFDNFKEEVQNWGEKFEKYRIKENEFINLIEEKENENS